MVPRDQYAYCGARGVVRLRIYSSVRGPKELKIVCSEIRWRSVRIDICMQIMRRFLSESILAEYTQIMRWFLPESMLTYFIFHEI